MAIDDNTSYEITGAQVKDLASKINDKAKATALTDGSVTKVGTGTVGGTSTPIYLNSGTPTAVNKPASGSWFKGVPDISSGGVMEVGKYLDFHNANADTSDFAVRLQTQGNNQATVNLPTASGTLALTSQLPLIGYSNAFSSPSNYGYREVDISSIPTGAKFAVFISGYAQLGAGANFAISSAYNGTQGQEIWANNSTGGVQSTSMSHIAVYTKAANNKLGFRLGYGQPNELRFFVLAVRIS